MTERPTKNRNNHSPMENIRASQFNKKRKKYTMYSDTSDSSSTSPINERYKPINFSEIRCGVWLSSTGPNFNLRHSLMSYVDSQPQALQNTVENATHSTENVCRSSLTSSFSKEDDVKMIQYFLNHKLLLRHARSTFVYKKMERKYSFGRTIHSLQKHFLGDIMPKLYTYDCLSMDEMIEFHDKTDIPSPELDKLVREHMLEKYGDSAHSSDFDSSESDSSLQDLTTENIFQKSNDKSNPPKKKQKLVQNNFNSVVIEDVLSSPTNSRSETWKNKQNFKSTLSVIDEGIEGGLPQSRKENETNKSREGVTETVSISTAEPLPVRNGDRSHVSKVIKSTDSNQKSKSRSTLCVINEEAEAGSLTSQIHSKDKAPPVSCKNGDSTKEIRNVRTFFRSRPTKSISTSQSHKRKLHYNNSLTAIEESAELLPSAANANNSQVSDYEMEFFKISTAPNYIEVECRQSRHLWVLSTASYDLVAEIAKARKIPFKNIHYVNKNCFDYMTKLETLCNGFRNLLDCISKVIIVENSKKKLVDKTVEEINQSKIPTEVSTNTNRICNEFTEIRRDESQTGGNLSILHSLELDQVLSALTRTPLIERTQNKPKCPTSETLRSKHNDSIRQDLSKPPELDDSLTTAKSNKQNELNMLGTAKNFECSLTNSDNESEQANESVNSAILPGGEDSLDILQATVISLRASQVLEISETSSDDNNILVPNEHNYTSKTTLSQIVECNETINVSDSDSSSSHDLILRTSCPKCTTISDFNVLLFKDIDSSKNPDCTQDQNKTSESIYLTAESTSQNNSNISGYKSDSCVYQKEIH